ncbi:MAG: hypothetical protein ACXVWF_00200 [Actinomycetota bacterium]
MTSMRTSARSPREVTEDTGRVATRVPVFAEIVGYVGGGLLVAAAMVFIGSRFGDYPIGVQIAIPAAVTLLLFALGWVTRGSAEPAARRFAAVCWFFAVPAFGVTLAYTVFWREIVDGLDLPRWAWITIFGVTTLFAGLLYGFERRTLAQLALFAGLFGTVFATLPLTADAGWSDAARFDFVAAMLGVFSAVWLVAGVMDRLAPRDTAIVLATFGLIVCTRPIDAEHHTIGLWIGLIIAAGLVVLGVRLRELPMEILGGLALLGTLIGLIATYFKGEASFMLALAATGGALLGFTAWLVWHQSHKRPPKSTSAGAAPSGA